MQELLFLPVLFIGKDVPLSQLHILTVRLHLGNFLWQHWPFIHLLPCWILQKYFDIVHACLLAFLLLFNYLQVVIKNSRDNFADTRLGVCRRFAGLLLGFAFC